MVLDPNKCILCGECVETCPVNALKIVTRDGATFVAPKNAVTMAESVCVDCGKCAFICSKGGIRIKSSI
ncbi:MAG: 4Fe-4S binding protein [Sedimentibacter sp.]